jgi:hypothetical protein
VRRRRVDGDFNMRLIDLNPRWFGLPPALKQGLTFDCPCCCNTDRAVRLAVPFVNPIDGSAPISLEPKILWPLLCPPPTAEGQVTVPPGFHWTRTGETFDVLTLSPSVDASKSGHWHGHIMAGGIV